MTHLGTSKLDVPTVKEIKNLYNNGVNQYELARRYNITQGAISKIVNSIHWKEVK